MMTRTVFTPFVLCFERSIYLARIMIMTPICGKFYACTSLCLALHFIKAIVCKYKANNCIMF